MTEQPAVQRAVKDDLVVELAFLFANLFEGLERFMSVFG